MNEERRQILDMLASGKISVEEAEKLLTAVSEPSEGQKKEEKRSSGSGPKYLRVQVEPGPGSQNPERVNIRVPMKLLRAGIKLASLIPANAQGKVDDALKEKGLNIDISQITENNIGDIIESLDELTVEVDGKEKVRIFCE